MSFLAGLFLLLDGWSSGVGGGERKAVAFVYFGEGVSGSRGDKGRFRPQTNKRAKEWRESPSAC